MEVCYALAHKCCVNRQNTYKHIVHKTILKLCYCVYSTLKLHLYHIVNKNSIQVYFWSIYDNTSVGNYKKKTNIHMINQCLNIGTYLYKMYQIQNIFF